MRGKKAVRGKKDRRTRKILQKTIGKKRGSEGRREREGVRGRKRE